MSTTKSYYHCVNKYKQKSDFRRTNMQIFNLELISRSKRKIGIHHERTKNGQDKKQGIKFIIKFKYKRITNQNRTKKNIIQKMIHIVSPFDEAGITQTTYRTIKSICKILHNNHERGEP